jgi:hypothetical protein
LFGEPFNKLDTTKKESGLLDPPHFRRKTRDIAPQKHKKDFSIGLVELYLFLQRNNYVTKVIGSESVEELPQPFLKSLGPFRRRE